MRSIPARRRSRRSSIDRRVTSWVAPTVALSLAVSIPAAAGGQLVRSAAGGSAGDILAAVNVFRADLGALNPNTPGSFGAGRREINWDGVGAAQSSPNAFPGTFFNAATPGRARGVELTTPGTELQVSAAVGEGPIQFDNLDPTYSATFEPFSPQKLFTAVGSNVVDVRFFVPGTSTPALTRGFGSVFSDVDLPNTTSITYFDAGGVSLGTFFVPNVVGGTATFSFLGVSYATPVVGRVRIVSGNVALGPGVVDGGRDDAAAMDDFVYGEPVAPSAVPEPSTFALAALGLAALGVSARRRHRRG